MANERLISAPKLVIDLAKQYHGDNGLFCYDKLMATIADAPTVDAVEVVHGRWMYDGDEVDGNIQAHCSNCFAGDVHATWKRNDIPYCWNCGAKMDGGNEDG